MKIYRYSFWITGAFAVFSFFIAKYLYTISSEQFYCNIFLGLFSSAALVAISSAIAYHLEKEKCKAQIKYCLTLLEHNMKHYKLTIIYAVTFRVCYTTDQLILLAYDYSYQIATVFSDLSLSQVSIIDKDILPLFNKYKAILEHMAVRLDKEPDQRAQIINEYFEGTEYILPRLEEKMKQYKLN